MIAWTFGTAFLGSVPEANAAWTTQTSGVATELTSISCTSESTCYAIGNGGIIRKTVNGGTSWSALTSGTAQTLNGVSCVTATNTCWAVGDSGTVIKTTDGTTWATQTSGTTDILLGVAAGSATSVFAVGENGRIIGTGDGGSSWSPLTSGHSGELNGVAIGGANASYIVGSNGKILKTTDNVSWSPQTSGTDEGIFGVACTDANTCFAVGSEKTIRTTTDGGLNWTARSITISDPEADFTGIDCINASTCYAVGGSGTTRDGEGEIVSSNGFVASTSDGGATWSVDATTFSGKYAAGVDFVAAGAAWLVGGGGLIAKVVLSAPVLSGGGPGDGQTFVPPEAIIDINSDINLDSGTVNTTNVTLYPCTGATDASSCASPNTASNACTTVSLQSDTTIICTGTLATDTTYRFQIGTGVQSTGNVALDSAVTRIFRTGSVSSGTNTTLPRVQETFPRAGETGVATNALLTFNFSAGPEGAMLADGSTNSITNHAAVRVRKVTNGVIDATDLCVSGCSLQYISEGQLVAVPGLTLAAATEYEMCVLANVVNTGTQALGTNYCSTFTTGAGADATAPTLAATDPLNPANGATGVSRFITSARVSFSEAIHPASISPNSIRLYIDANSNGVYDSGSETRLNDSDVIYKTEKGSKTVSLGLQSALDASTRYCYSITTGIQDMIGNAFAATSEDQCFTTGSTADTTAPTILYADADSFKVLAHFSEPVTTAGAKTAANYALQCPTGVPISLTSKTIQYFPDRQEAEIQGLGLPPGQDCKLTITGVTDLAGNTISTSNNDNVANFTVLDAANTGGFLGGGGADQDFMTNTNMASFWEKPERCAPRSRIVGKSTDVECEFSAPAALASGSTFTITVPSGFDASSVIAKANSFPNKDLNGPETNKPTIASVASVTGSVVVTTGTATIASGERIRFELSGLTNSSTAANDLRFSIIVKDSSGVKKGQTINASPFQLATGGALSISGTVYKDSNSNGTPDGGEGISGVTVFCTSNGGFGAGAIMAGNSETTTAANGTWTISSLSAGSYGCGIPPDPTRFEDMGGGDDFKSVFLESTSKTGLDFSFVDLSSTGKTLSVTIASGATLSAKEVDVYCHAGAFDAGFSKPVMKVVTLDGAGAGTTTMKLSGGKTYECGVGPHMDFSNFTGGGPPPVPEFDFMPPEAIQVNVPTDGNPDAVTFSLEVASNTITGTVVDGSANGIANVFVDAFPLGCFDATTGEQKACRGGFAQSKSDGTFTLNVSPGTYEVGATAPGMPPTEGQIVTVTTTNVSGVSIKLSKSSTTIAGQVLDESGNAIQFAGVDAERVAAGGTCTSSTNAGGFTFSPTDSSGNYTLYAADGTWIVRAHAPSYGEVGCTTVVLSGASKSGQDIQATAADYAQITGTCLSGSFIGAYGPSGGNQTSCSEGAYTLKVKGGAGYTVECFAHGTGPCGRQQSVDTSSSNATVNFATSISTGTLEVTITGITDAFVDARDSSGLGSSTGKNTSGVYTMNLAAGSYTVRGGSPKYGDLCGDQAVTLTANATSSVTCAPPANLRSVVGRVTDGTSNLAGASVTITDSTGRMFNKRTGSQTGVNNNLSLTNVPDGSYTIRASKNGYQSASTPATVSGGNLTLSSNLELTQATGANGASVTVTVRDDADTAYTGDARVVATDVTGKKIVGKIDKTNGQASLGLTNGTWSVVGYSDNGKQTEASTVTVTAGTASGSPTIDLDNSVEGFTAANNNVNFTPKSGGLIKSEDITGLAINVPSSTFSTTDSSTATMKIKTTSEVIGIDPGDDQNVVGAYGFDISPTDANGKEMSDLNGTVTITIPYTDNDVSTAGVGESGLVVGAIDANGEWETFPTTVDTTNNTLTVDVSHFSTFGILGSSTSSGSPTSSDVTSPGAATNISSSATSSGVTLAWTDPTDGDLSTIEILRSTPPSTAVSGTPRDRIAKGVGTYTDSGVTAGQTYTYILRSKDTSGNTRNSGTVSITVPTATAAPTTGSTSPATPTTTPAVTTPTVSGPAESGASAIGLPAGSLVKSTASSAVYLVGADGKRYAYPNVTVYNTWHEDFSGVKTISTEQLASLTLGGLVTVRPGTVLVKIESDPKVYAVEPGGGLRWIETEDRAKLLYGNAWNKNVIDVAVSFWPSYSGGSALGMDIHPTGSLVSMGGATYYVDNGKRRAVSSSVFGAQGFQKRFVHVLNAALAYEVGPALGSDTMLTFASVR
jgi:photosystem II stability/assembly factor-like uncharacterized protein